MKAKKILAVKSLVCISLLSASNVVIIYDEALAEEDFNSSCSSSLIEVAKTNPDLIVRQISIFRQRRQNALHAGRNEIGRAHV